MVKIVLYLMNEKGYFVLSEYLRTGNDPRSIAAVISSEDKGTKNDYYNEIRRLCEENGISFNNKAQTREWDADYTMAIGWRWLIPNCENLIVFHDSLLPKYRGFAPLVSSLINGETQIGVTALYASDRYDEGDIISKSELFITYPIKIQEAIERIKHHYSCLFLEIMQKICNKEALPRISQDHSEASYSLWRDDDDYRINWEQNAGKIKRFIDSVGFPYKGASTLMDDNKKIRILDAEVVDDLKIENRDAGKIIFMEMDYPTVVCGQGLLKIRSAVYDETELNALPLRKFRTRFK